MTSNSKVQQCGGFSSLISVFCQLFCTHSKILCHLTGFLQLWVILGKKKKPLHYKIIRLEIFCNGVGFQFSLYCLKNLWGVGVSWKEWWETWEGNKEERRAEENNKWLIIIQILFKNPVKNESYFSVSCTTSCLLDQLWCCLCYERQIRMRNLIGPTLLCSSVHRFLLFLFFVFFFKTLDSFMHQMVLDVKHWCVLM